MNLSFGWRDLLIFGEIKGLKPHGGYLISFLVVLFVVEIIGLAGYLEGFNVEGVSRAGPVYNWSQSTLLYSAALILSSLTSVTLLVRSEEDKKMKMGGCVFVCLPILIFCSGLLREI